MAWSPARPPALRWQTGGRSVQSKALYGRAGSSANCLAQSEVDGAPPPASAIWRAALFFLSGASGAGVWLGSAMAVSVCSSDKAPFGGLAWLHKEAGDAKRGSGTSQPEKKPTVLPADAAGQPRQGALARHGSSSPSDSSDKAAPCEGIR